MTRRQRRDSCQRAARLERPEVLVTALVPVRVARKLAPATRRGIVRVAGSIMRRQPDGQGRGAARTSNAPKGLRAAGPRLRGAPGRVNDYGEPLAPTGRHAAPLAPTGRRPPRSPGGTSGP